MGISHYHSPVDDDDGSVAGLSISKIVIVICSFQLLKVRTDRSNIYLILKALGHPA